MSAETVRRILAQAGRGVTAVSLDLNKSLQGSFAVQDEWL